MFWKSIRWGGTVLALVVVAIVALSPGASRHQPSAYGERALRLH